MTSGEHDRGRDKENEMQRKEKIALTQKTMQCFPYPFILEYLRLFWQTSEPKDLSKELKI